MRKLLLGSLFVSIILMSLGLTQGAIGALDKRPVAATTGGDAPLTWLNQLGGTVKGLVVRDNRAYVGTGAQLAVFDLTNPAQPALLGQTAPGVHLVRDVALYGNYAYVVDGGEMVVQGGGIVGWSGGMRVVDISNPQQPQVVATITVPDYPTYVAVQGHYAYISCMSKFSIWDLTDPLHPTRTGTYTAAIYPPTAGIVLPSGTVAYYAIGSIGLVVVDISNPNQPQELGRYLPDTLDKASVIAIRDHYAYLADSSGSGISVVDVSNSTAMQEVGSYSLGGVNDIAIAGSYAYAVHSYGGFTGLTILDISGTTPVKVGGLELPGKPLTIQVVGNFAYLSGELGGVWVVKVSNPAAPTQAGIAPLVGYAHDVTLFKSYAHVWGSGWHIINIANPAQPREVGYDENGGPLATVGNYGYQVFGNSGGQAGGNLRVLNLTDPVHPQEITRISLPGYVQGVAAAGNFVYVNEAFDYNTGVIRVVDVANPQAPVVRGTYTNTSASQGYANGMAVVGSWLYVCYPSAFTILDVSDPDYPGKIGEYTDSIAPRRVVVRGKYAYVASGVWASHPGLWIFDVSDPENPALLGVYHGGWQHTMGLAVEGNRAYIATDMSGLHVVDIADPYNPYPVGVDGKYVNNIKPYYYGGVAVSGGTIFAANGDNGLEILRELPPSTISGQVVDSAGQPLAGVTVWAGMAYSATTTLSGTYVLTNVLAGTYTVRPELPGYLPDPPTRTVTVPPSATGQDFVARHLYKTATPSGLQALHYGETVTYTVQVVVPAETSGLFYDAVPTGTTYLTESLVAPAGVVYDPELNAITGTVTAAAYTPLSITFAVQAVITGTAESAPRLTNQACLTGPLTECSNVVTNYTYVWATYLPLVMRQY